MYGISKENQKVWAHFKCVSTDHLPHLWIIYSSESQASDLSTYTGGNRLLLFNSNLTMSPSAHGSVEKKFIIYT